MIFGHEEEITILRKEVEEKNTQLQDLVNGLTRENMTLKQDMEDLQKRVDQWDSSIEKIFGLTIEELTELEEDIPKQETQTPQKMIKITQQKEERISPVKIVKEPSTPSIMTIQKKEPEKTEISTKDCPECGGKESLKNGRCLECGYREIPDLPQKNKGSAN